MVWLLGSTYRCLVLVITTGRVTAALLILLVHTAPAHAAAKTDLVELLNGDRITCEIRKLDRGKLTVKTDGIGTIAIEWDDVSRITSAERFDVELASGLRVFGSFARGDSGTVDVVTSSGAQRLPLPDIVRLSPVGDTFWGRLEGAIDAGFSFTQANVQTQWTLHTNLRYRSRWWLSAIDADSALTSRDDADRQTRNTLSIETQRFLRARWSALGFAQFQQNEELSLNLRAVLGIGVLKVLSQSNRSLLSAEGGAAFTREQYAGAGDEHVAEAVAGLSWEWFTFDGRSTNLEVGALSFYALNRDMRLRLELNAKFKSDIVGDLYWSINLFDSYNSDPPSGRKGNDSGVSAAVGWAF
jgi:hypothetical protein